MADPAIETAYLAPEGYVDELARELGDVSAVYDRLLVAPGPARRVAWAANIWHAPRRLSIRSIGDGAKALRTLQRNWCLYPVAHYGRARLIEAQLPHVSARPLRFPEPAPKAPLGSWTLLEPGTLLAAERCSSAFPNGEVRFEEDREAPPNRAYLKLWEALTLLGERPGPGDRCLDLGSSPGGWTWVAQQLGAHVTSVDKAPLDPRIARLPRVAFRRESAFGVDPGAFERVDWLFCDVACYPARLLGLVQRWIESGRCRRIVATIKLQGTPDPEVAKAFIAIPGARVRHLFHNKHELTFDWTSVGMDAYRRDANEWQE